MNNKSQEDMENVDHQRPEETPHINDVRFNIM